MWSGMKLQGDIAITVFPLAQQRNTKPIQILWGFCNISCSFIHRKGVYVFLLQRNAEKQHEFSMSSHVIACEDMQKTRFSWKNTSWNMWHHVAYMWNMWSTHVSHVIPYISHGNLHGLQITPWKCFSCAKVGHVNLSFSHPNRLTIVLYLAHIWSN